MTEPRDSAVLALARALRDEYGAPEQDITDHLTSAERIMHALAEHGHQIAWQAGMPRLVASDAIPEDEVWFMRGRKVVGKITGLAAAQPTGAGEGDHHPTAAVPLPVIVGVIDLLQADRDASDRDLIAHYVTLLRGYVLEDGD